MRVCFVCLGNICRSPAAAAVFTRLASEAGVDVTVDSAGTIDHHLGEAPHGHSLAEATRRGLTIEHRSRQFTLADFERFDLIVALDESNRRDLLRLAPDDTARAKVALLGHGVPDPFGRPESAFAEMYDLLEDRCAELLEDLTSG